MSRSFNLNQHYTKYKIVTVRFFLALATFPPECSKDKMMCLFLMEFQIIWHSSLALALYA